MTDINTTVVVDTVEAPASVVDAQAPAQPTIAELKRAIRLEGEAMSYEAEVREYTEHLAELKQRREAARKPQVNTSDKVHDIALNAMARVGGISLPRIPKISIPRTPAITAAGVGSAIGVGIGLASGDAITQVIGKGLLGLAAAVALNGGVDIARQAITTHPEA